MKAFPHLALSALLLSLVFARAAEARIQPPPVLDIWVEVGECNLGGVTVTYARITFHGYTTFGSTEPSFCACGLSKAGGICGSSAPRRGDRHAVADFGFQLSSNATASVAEVWPAPTCRASWRPSQAW